MLPPAAKSLACLDTRIAPQAPGSPGMLTPPPARRPECQGLAPARVGPPYSVTLLRQLATRSECLAKRRVRTAMPQAGMPAPRAGQPLEWTAYPTVQLGSVVYSQTSRAERAPFSSETVPITLRCSSLTPAAMGTSRVT